MHTPPIDAPFFYRSRPRRLFHPGVESLSPFPIQAVRIDWDRLIAKRSTVLKTIKTMPAYLLNPKCWACSRPNSIRPTG